MNSTYAAILLYSAPPASKLIAPRPKAEALTLALGRKVALALAQHAGR